MAYTPELQDWSGAKSYTALQAIAFTPYMVQNEWIYGKLPWGSDADSYNVFLRYVKLHYRLIPCIYSQMWEQHTTGIGPIRPLPLEFQDDEQTYSISNQYCYGRYLMVSFDHSSIYLPQGKWTYYWDGRTFEGGRTLTNFRAPADELPVFVRAGAIIPMMPDMKYVGEKPIDPLMVDVYPEGTSTFTLYEDDGISYDYEKGEYCTTEYQAVQRAGSVTLDIGTRKAPGAYVPPQRHYLFRVHTGSDPGKVYLDGTALEKQTLERALSASAGGWYYADGVAQIRFADSGKRMRLGLGTWIASSAGPGARTGER
jgi:alpha-glucosidase (family GH31 glycosyl hydrolase)